MKSALVTIWNSDFMPQATLGFAFVILAAILSSIAPTLASIALVIGALITIGTLTFGFQPVRERIGPRRDYWRAATFGKKGMAAEALTLADRFCEKRPADPRGWEARALALAGLGRLEDALKAADRAVSRKPRWQGLMIRGQILSGLGLPAEAEADLRASLRLHNHSLTQILLAGGLVGLRRLEAAIDTLRGARRLSALRWSPGFLVLGEAHRLLGRKQEATEAYEQGVKRARAEIKASIAVHSLLAGFLANLGQSDAAEAVAGSALQKNPCDVGALGAQATVRMQAGDRDGVERLLQRIITLHPQGVVGTLVDPKFTPLLTEVRFRRLLAWALGAQRQVLERVRNRQTAAAMEA